MRQLRGRPLTQFLKKSTRPETELLFVLQDIQDPINVGSCFRIGDACGVSEILLTGISTRPPHPLIKKVGRGRDRRVNWRYVEETTQAIAECAEAGFTICALEITAESVPYYEPEYPDKLCLVVGHEDHGVTNRTLSACDTAVFIPMYGKGASLNVHVSLGIVAYHILHQHPGELT